jgi:hypothetical protein
MMVGIRYELGKKIKRCGKELPLYCVVSKLRPTKLGNKKVFFVKSHVPSPTVIVSESYVAVPGADSPSAGAMMAVDDNCKQVGL